MLQSVYFILCVIFFLVFPNVSRGLTVLQKCYVSKGIKSRQLI